MEVVLCAHQAFNVFYYKYTVDVMNIVLVNLLLIVFLTLCFGFIEDLKHHVGSVCVCVCVCVCEVLPPTF